MVEINDEFFCRDSGLLEQSLATDRKGLAAPRECAIGNDFNTLSTSAYTPCG